MLQSAEGLTDRGPRMPDACREAEPSDDDLSAQA